MGNLDALVTAPICKKSWQLAGIDYSGHTTLLQKMTESKIVSMVFLTKKLKVILVTIHIPLNQVSQSLTKKRIEEKIKHAHEVLLKLGIKNPKITVAGLNPHASEESLFGNEEAKIIQPAIESMVKEGIAVSGPYPPDIIFRQALSGKADIVVALYHDQGLIPLKLIGFDQAVNMTWGLPFIRTSPDHGTAFDIAYKNQADEKSMQNAIQLAVQMSKKSNDS